MFAENLKALRKRKGYSQASLAATLEISQQAVGKWETGRSQPDPQTLVQLADLLEISVDYLLGRKNPDASGRQSQWSAPEEVMIPVIGTVKAGYNAVAFEEDCGYEPARVKSPDNYFYLMVRGDSMEPRISRGDLALVHKQPDVDSGDLAVVLVDGEEGTLKKVIKQNGAVILQPFNPSYETMVFVGEDLGRLSIVGKVVETKSKW